jgi:hypothetical protein
MASSNTNIQVTDLDFGSIKSNFITYLQSQNTLKDYNYQGSALSTLLDVLSYNTQYNAYYLNMVANEMFLDSAIQRSSVISHAKLLNYTPKSAIAPSALINFTASGVNSPSFTIPKFTNFMSEPIDGVNYNFVTKDSVTVNTTSGVAQFNNLELKQGIPSTYAYTVSSITNPSFTYQIPDSNVDTTTIQVFVQKSTSNTAYDIYQPAKDYLNLNSTSKVYFVQESLNGKYEIYFGDGILGKKLEDGNVVLISYISTEGTASAGANNFALMSSLPGFTTYSIIPVSSATQGGDKESIESIKFQAPKSFSAQNRAVSKEDYITAIQQNSLGFAFDAVNVWGGEENDPPVYGQVFVCLKPKGSYNFTQTQKQRIIQEVIKPISMMTVTPTIVDPDYTYIKLNVNVYYDPALTTQTSSQIKSGITTAINNFASTSLNTFNSTFNSYDLLNAIQSYDKSIITSEYDLKLQKKFFPNLTIPTTYNLYFNTELKKGIFLTGITSSPAMKFRDPTNLTLVKDGIYVEEVPTVTNGIDTISVINPGFGYTSTPKVEIIGDGTGAAAHAVVVNGSIKSVVVDNPGTGYTSAIALVTPLDGDTTGRLGALTVQLQGRYGLLRSYFNNTLNNVKSVFNNNVGTVDYSKGIITLNSFSPLNVDNDLGQLALTATPTTSIISSTYNRVITVDPYDPTAITVNVIAKTSGK